VLIGRYFYGKAHKYKWIPDWKQFQLYWRHMKEDGLDCLDDPFIQATSAPADDPFASVPAPVIAKPAPAKPAPAKPASTAAPAPAAAPAHTGPFQNAPLAGQPDLENIANGHGLIKQGARGAGVKALQQALINLGFTVSGGADGAYGPG